MVCVDVVRERVYVCVRGAGSDPLSSRLLSRSVRVHLFLSFPQEENLPFQWNFIKVSCVRQLSVSRKEIRLKADIKDVNGAPPLAIFAHARLAL
jgi:hypothetical protein